MKAVVYKDFGAIDVLQTIEEPKPSIKSNQVLVKVKAVSINPIDWKIRKGEMKLMSGSHFPKHIGADFSGIVDSAGDKVVNFKKGDEIFGVVNAMKEGALMEFVATGEDKIWHKPQNISFNQAATIPIVGAAAILALQKIGKTTPQSEILINGATGGLGMYLMQLLKQQGAILTTVSSSAGIESAKKWGADFVIDYTKQNVLELGKEYDVVVDLSGKMGYDKARQIMKDHSSFINPTPGTANIITTPILNIFAGKKHLVLLSNPSSENVPMLLEAIKNGLQIEVSRTFPFNQVAEAYQYAEKGGYIGKVTVEIE